MFLYRDKDTYLHKLDPRTKIFVLLVSFVLPLMYHSIPVLLILGGLIICYGAAGKSLTNLGNIKHILIMIGVFSVLIWSLMAGITPLYLGIFSLEGALYGVAMGIKLNIMIIAGMIFLSATRMEEISLGLVKLGLPYRAAFAFSTALRLVPLISGSVATITQAQRSRGLDLASGGLVTRTKKHLPLLIPAFLSVIRDTNTFAMALEAKGFGYSKQRSSYLCISFKLIDFIMLGAATLALATGFYFKYTTSL